MRELERAMTWACEYHMGQTDSAGVPYIAHICAVVSAVKTGREKTVAALHDIMEDCDVTEKEIFVNFGAEVAEAVDAITKRDNEPYKEYLSRVAANNLARTVKIADLLHNMDLTRLPKITEKDKARLEKYRDALDFLRAARPSEEVE